MGKEVSLSWRCSCFYSVITWRHRESSVCYTHCHALWRKSLELRPPVGHKSVHGLLLSVSLATDGKRYLCGSDGCKGPSDPTFNLHPDKT